MSYTQEDCIRDTQGYIDQVKVLMGEVISRLMLRAVDHDKSKLKSPELEIFTEYTPKLKTSTYGSDEYKEFLKEMKDYYTNNSHHSEYYSDGIRGMDLLDIIEMVCDWKAATMRHDDGDIMKSIEINQKRFGISDELTQIIRNTVERYLT